MTGPRRSQRKRAYPRGVYPRRVLILTATASLLAAIALGRCWYDRAFRYPDGFRGHVCFMGAGNSPSVTVSTGMMGVALLSGGLALFGMVARRRSRGAQTLTASLHLAFTPFLAFWAMGPVWRLVGYESLVAALALLIGTCLCAGIFAYRSASVLSRGPSATAAIGACLLIAQLFAVLHGVLLGFVL